MTISIAGYVLVIYLIIVALLKSNDLKTWLVRLFAINLYLEGFINIGYFALSGETIFKMSDFLQFLMAFLSLFIYISLPKRKINLPLSLIIFFFIILLNLINLELFPYDKLVRTFDAVDRVNAREFMHYPKIDLQSIKTSIRMLTFLWNALAIIRILDFNNWERIKNVFVRLGIVLIIWGWIEFILRNVIGTNAFTSVLNVVFGNDSTIINSLTRNNFYVIVGLNNEPSQFAMTLAYFLVFYIIAEHQFKTKAIYNILVLSAIGLMFLSGSFRMVGLLPLILIIYLIDSGVRLRVVVVFSLLFIFGGITYRLGFLDYYLERLDNAFLFLQTRDATIPGGEAGRLNTAREALMIFFDRPLLGIGPGTTFAYGFIPSMLVMTGLIGTSAWYYLMFYRIGSVRFSAAHIKQALFIFALTVIWLYTSAIDIAYSIVIFGIAIEFRSQNERLEIQNK